MQTSPLLLLSLCFCFVLLPGKQPPLPTPQETLHPAGLRAPSATAAAPLLLDPFGCGVAVLLLAPGASLEDAFCTELLWKSTFVVCVSLDCVI